MAIKYYTEFGIGNETFINTEIEYPDGTEIRQPGYIHGVVYHRPYIRLWIGKKVWIASMWKLSKQTKPYKTFKLLFGFEGF